MELSHSHFLLLSPLGLLTHPIQGCHTGDFIPDPISSCSLTLTAHARGLASLAPSPVGPVVGSRLWSPWSSGIHLPSRSHHCPLCLPILPFPPPSGSPSKFSLMPSPSWILNVAQHGRWLSQARPFSYTERAQELDRKMTLLFFYILEALIPPSLLT